MRLRNKKTGEILFSGWFDGEISCEKFEFKIKFKGNNGWQVLTYHSLAELNEEWEDYEPKEPLIKDEKIRKAVRAWAGANDFARVFYEYDYSNDVARFIVGETVMIIEADEVLEDCRAYTIAELCGEEEE